MAELFGAIMRGLGFVLNAAYEAVPSYALAIVILTVVTRALLIPLTVKQTKSMQAMQLAQPEMKAIQAKYKELQKKVKDRLELQQLRLKQNEEVQAVFRKYGANPASGCLPMLAQMPVFICLFSVMRAGILFSAAPVSALPPDRFVGTEVVESRVGDLEGDDADKRLNALLGEISKVTICRPEEGATSSDQVSLSCATSMPNQELQTTTIELGELQEVDKGGQPLGSTIDWTLVAFCRPVVVGAETQFESFGCSSAAGSGHLPRDGELFRDVNADSATIFGMHPGCSPSQSNSDFGIRQCTATDSEGGFPSSLPYYLLVVAIAGTQYVSGKQMMARAKGPAAQQQQTMTRIMPVFFGLISLGFPTGLNFYYLIFNIWQIGQQWFIFRHMDQQQAAGGPVIQPKKPGLADRMRQKLEEQQRAVQAVPEEAETPAAAAPGGSKPHPRSKKRKKKKRK